MHACGSDVDSELSPHSAALSPPPPQTVQSVYPDLDKYTLAGGGVRSTHCVFGFN